VRIGATFTVSNPLETTGNHGNPVATVSTGFQFGFHGKVRNIKPVAMFPIYSGVKLGGKLANMYAIGYVCWHKNQLRRCKYA